MNRFRFLDVDVTRLEGLSPKPTLINSLFKPKFYVVFSVTTPALLITKSRQETPLANPLENKTHEWNSLPLRFDATVSKFHEDCSMLVLQLRMRRRFLADKDVGKPLVIPVLDLFERAVNNKDSLSNAAVYGVSKKKNKNQQGYLYFSYKFSNSWVVRRDRGASEGAWQSDSRVSRQYKDAHQRPCSLEDINDAAYQLLLFRDNAFVHVFDQEIGHVTV